MWLSPAVKTRSNHYEFVDRTKESAAEGPVQLPSVFLDRIKIQRPTRKIRHFELRIFDKVAHLLGLGIRRIIQQHVHFLLKLVLQRSKKSIRHVVGGAVYDFGCG
jgi:hypothetical protein